MTPEEIKKEAKLYADSFSLKAETGGWHQQKAEDFTAGYEAALCKLNKKTTMNQELENALKVIATEKQDAIAKRFELANSFRMKINLLISKTPTGELRNELSELNILHEAILINNVFLNKL